MRLAGILTLLAAALALPAFAADAAVSVADPVRLVTLRNGMRVLLAPDTAAAAVDVAVWYRAGTTHERAGITGISHLFEHLMFAGSGRYGPLEHGRLIQAEGGSANALTTPDFACYYQTIPPAALELALRLEADRMASLRLTAEALENEKRVVRDERRRQGEMGPGGEVLQSLFRLGWRAHPYRWPILGLAEDVGRIQLADCQAYYEGHYAPNNATVTIVGNFDPEHALQLAERWLQPLKRRRVRADAPPAEPTQNAERRAREQLDVPVPMLAVGWKTPGASDPDGPAFELLGRLLASGPGSRLQRALVLGRPRCLSVQAGFESRRDGGLLYAVAAVRPRADSAAVESTLVAEVERLAREPLAQDELERASRNLELGTLLSWQTVRGRAQALGEALLVRGDHRSAALGLDRLRQLTPSDVQRAAARVLGAAGRNVVWMVPDRTPGSPPAGTEGTSESETASSPAEGGR